MNFYCSLYGVQFVIVGGCSNLCLVEQCFVQLYCAAVAAVSAAAVVAAAAACPRFAVWCELRCVWCGQQSVGSDIPGLPQEDGRAAQGGRGNAGKGTCS